MVPWVLMGGDEQGERNKSIDFLHNVRGPPCQLVFTRSDLSVLCIGSYLSFLLGGCQLWLGGPIANRHVNGATRN